MPHTRPAPYMIVGHEMAWTETTPGVFQKTLWQAPMWNDPAIPREVGLVRCKPGTQLPVVRYHGDAFFYILEGTLACESHVLTAGYGCTVRPGSAPQFHSTHGTTFVCFRVGRVEPATKSDGPPIGMVNVNELPWTEIMEGRARLKSIWRDDSTQRHVMFWWLKPGLVQPLHEHLGEELVYMMEGCLMDEGGTVSAGNLGVRPYGCHHSFTTPNGALGLAYMWGSTAYV